MGWSDGCWLLRVLVPGVETGALETAGQSGERHQSDITTTPSVIIFTFFTVLPSLIERFGCRM